MHALENNKIDLISWPETHQAILVVFHQTKHLEASWICGWTTRRKGPPKKSRIHICCISLPLFLTIHKLAGVWLVPLPPGFFFSVLAKVTLKWMVVMVMMRPQKTRRQSCLPIFSTNYRQERELQRTGVEERGQLSLSPLFLGDDLLPSHWLQHKKLQEKWIN